MNQEIEFAYDADLMPGVEPITYKPHGGSSRSIDAQVFREGVQPAGDGTNVAVMTIRCRNHTTAGIGTSEINVSADKVSVAFRKGGTARDYHIGQLLSSDDQEIEFRVQGRSD